MPSFATGAVKFQKDIYPAKKELFEVLSQGQHPEAFFLTCSDSRVETAMMTQTDPGDLFICRNAGNIIPPHTQKTGGITASLEFAVAVLNVPHIVVCGHTDCGAMKAALSGEGLEELPHVKEWLGFSKAAVDVVNALDADMSESERLRMLLKKNVILQLQHLKTHPCVAVKLAKGELQLHGWVYDIKNGKIYAYDDVTDTFETVDDSYAAKISAVEKQGACCE